jgi:hypothetical protein
VLASRTSKAVPRPHDARPRRVSAISPTCRHARQAGDQTARQHFRVSDSGEKPPAEVLAKRFIFMQDTHHNCKEEPMPETPQTPQEPHEPSPFIALPTDAEMHARAAASGQKSPYDFGFISGMGRLLAAHERIGPAMQRTFFEIMFAPGALTRAEREMIAAVASAAQDCEY